MRTASALDGNDVRTAGTATYETGQTRQFFHGRTETVRSFCAESVEWTKAMTDESASKQKRIELLRKAIDHHSKTLMADSTNGSCTLSLSRQARSSALTLVWTSQHAAWTDTCWD
jgi:hypothetical protein